MSADTLIRAALDAGVELQFIDGKLIAVGKRAAIAKMAEPIRAGKADLIRWFTQTPANELSVEPRPDPASWHDLDRAYQAHHVNCKFCQAAGRGAIYGKRCAVGITLWQMYSASTKDGHEQI